MAASPTTLTIVHAANEQRGREGTASCATSAAHASCSSFRSSSGSQAPTRHRHRGRRGATVAVRAGWRQRHRAVGGNVRDRQLLELVSSEKQLEFLAARRLTHCPVTAATATCASLATAAVRRTAAQRRLTASPGSTTYAPASCGSSGTSPSRCGDGGSAHPGVRSRRTRSRLRHPGRGSRPQRAVHVRQRAQVEALPRDRVDAITRIAPAATLAGRGGGLADSGKPWRGPWIRGLRSLLRLGACAGQVG